MPRPAEIPYVQWRDWVWQMQERVRSAKDLERCVNPTDDERQAIDALAERFRFVITPYYCYQAQLLEGTGHFRVPVERGLEIFRELRGRTSGFAIPTYVLDTPYGKVPLGYPYLKGRDGDHVVVEAWDGRIWRELNPAE
jgi:lysine 2,3-aminomutase